MTGTTIAAVLGALVLALLVTVALGASRLRVLSSRIGSFECAARRGGAPGGSWVAGIAHYGAGRIDWWRSWSLAPRPAHTWWRADLDVVDRTPFVGPGEVPHLVVRCRYHGRDLELTRSDDAFAGFTEWLEAAPPSDVSRVI